MQLAAWMFYEFGAGIHSAFLLVTCMQSAHVDSTCTVTDCLLEVHKSLQARTCLVRDVCDSIKHADGFTDFLLEVHKPPGNDVDPLECFVTATNHVDEMVTDCYLKYTNLLGIFLSHCFFSSINTGFHDITCCVM